MPAVRLLVGGHASRVQGEPQDLAGDRMFTAAHPPQTGPFAVDAKIDGTIDSGAFTDPPHRRLTPDAALARQLDWERRATAKWGIPFQASGLVSYDRLIDEKWIAGERHKQRWSVAEGDSAVAETVAAAQCLASQRANLAPRRLILSCQGVDAYQYQECVSEVLKVATPADWIGLGGWCIIGMRHNDIHILLITRYGSVLRRRRQLARRASLAGAEIKLALNHWKLAVETHNTNFPTPITIAPISARSIRAATQPLTS
jgi:hypothetical protein